MKTTTTFETTTGMAPVANPYIVQIAAAPAWARRKAKALLQRYEAEKATIAIQPRASLKK